MRMKLPCGRGVRDDVGHVAIGELRIEIESEMRQLERDIGLQTLRRDAVEIRLVLVDDGSGGGWVLDPFAEQRGVGAQTALIERSQDGNRLGECLAGDEA